MPSAVNGVMWTLWGVYEKLLREYKLKIIANSGGTIDPDTCSRIANQWAVKNTQIEWRKQYNEKK